METGAIDFSSRAIGFAVLFMAVLAFCIHDSSGSS